MPNSSDPMTWTRTEHVEFNFAVAASTRDAFTSAARIMTDQPAIRQRIRTAGSQQFCGHFAQIFADNGRVQVQDAQEIATALSQVVAVVTQLERAAREENKRRDKANAALAAYQKAKAEYDAKPAVERWWIDTVEGGPHLPDPPRLNPQESVAAPQITTPRPALRQVPSPGEGGHGGGTSSAVPARLKGFATASRAADQQLPPVVGRLRRACNDFASSCRWTTLDASGPISALSAWLVQNEQDAHWADVVGAAFAAAGGSGDVRTLSDSALGEALTRAHVSSRRADLAVQPAWGFGQPPTTGYADDPVNAATGNFVEAACDLSFPGGASALNWVRTYNSADDHAGPLGTGWSCPASARLDVSAEGAALWLPEGRQIWFPRQDDGWDRPAGENLWLTKGGRGWMLTGLDGLRWHFDAAGRPTSSTQGPGSQVTWTWDDEDRLLRLTHEFGRSLTLLWDGLRLTGVRSGDSRQVDYVHDENGHLVDATNSEAGQRYEWDGDRVVGVVDRDGVREVLNTYDEDGRVVSQTSAAGRTSHYTYLPGGVVQVADEDGQRANTWVHDARGRLVRVVDTKGHAQNSVYDKHGNLVMVTGRTGHVQTWMYDRRGRRVGEVTPLGARVDTVYDEADRPVHVTVTGEDVRAVTTFEYEGAERNPCLIVDPCGGRTRMRWSDGLLLQVTDATGVTMRFEYDAHGDLIASTDALGNTARLERDAAGRVIAAITPSGHRTRYEYDERGLCTRRTDPDGSVWRFEYTAAGRVRAQIDPLGGRVQVDHDDAGQEEATIDELGRRIERSHDDLGLPTAMRLPDGSTWTYGWDAEAQLRRISDPSGASVTFDHDADGLLTATTDAVGDVRQFGHNAAGQDTSFTDAAIHTTADYDKLGRLVEMTAPDGSVTRVRHDLCGRPVEIIDAADGHVLVERDAAGRPVAVTQPMGATFRYEYDECGRHRATVSTGGDRYEFSYDADGKVVGETWPTGEQVTTRFDALGRPVERWEPGSGRTRLTYDAVGRVVRCRDPWYGTRTFSYDAAGQLTSVSDALGHVTHYTYDPVGRVDGVTDPLGARTRAEYDVCGRPAQITDPLGRVTRYTWDAAGRPAERVDGAGQTLSWTWDHAGRLATESVNGSPAFRYAPDEAHRRYRVTQHTDDGPVDHTLTFDALGNLLTQQRDDGDQSWSWDANGRLTSMTRPNRRTTTYTYDENSQVTGLQVDGLGSLHVERDAIGRPTHATGDDFEAVWTWRDGFLAQLRTVRGGYISDAQFSRDDDGRLVEQTVDGIVTTFSYDAAGQLVDAHTSDGMHTHMEYDEAGRLVREETSGKVTRFEWDAASQLARRTDATGTTQYHHDGAGRRISEDGPAGRRRFAWDPHGHLRDVVEVTGTGDSLTAQRTTSIRTDPFGQTYRVDDTPVWWDLTALAPQMSQWGAATVESALGPAAVDTARSAAQPADPDATGPTVTGQNPTRPAVGEPSSPLPGADAPIGSSWSVPGPGRADVWGGPVPAGPTLGGGLGVAGLEVMGARVFDPASRGFLSPDPLPSPTGTPWSGNPYAFAGNDPVNLTDPWGLSPVSADSLAALRQADRPALARGWDATTQWVSANRDWLVNGAMTAAGIALMATGVGGPAGMMLLSAGIDGLAQKAMTGNVDYRQVAISGAAGALGGGFAGLGRAAAARMSTCLGRNVVSSAVEGGSAGAFTGAGTYLVGPGPHTVTGLAQATGGGAASGLVSGGGMGALSKLTPVARYGCFDPDTPVLMADGTSKPIKDVSIGDEVITVDPETGARSTAPVEQVWRHEQVPTLVVETGDGGTLTCTASHPLHVVDRGWVRAADLQPGDQFWTTDHDSAPVHVTQVTPTGHAQTVYNLTVTGHHTYHVATTSGTWILAHNGCDIYYDHTVKRWRGPNGKFVKVPDEVKAVQEAVMEVREKGYGYLEGLFTPEERKAVENHRWLGRLYAGRHIQAEAWLKLRAMKQYEGVKSMNVGPDIRFTNKTQVEITTNNPGTMKAHQMRTGDYDGAYMVTYPSITNKELYGG